MVVGQVLFDPSWPTTQALDVPRNALELVFIGERQCEICVSRKLAPGLSDGDLTPPLWHPSHQGHLMGIK